jgi:hypothetical protein
MWPLPFGLPEQAVGFGLVIEDKPTEFSCMYDTLRTT